MNTFVMNGAVMNGTLIPEPFVGTNAEASFFAEAGVNNYRPNVRGTSVIIVLEDKAAGQEWSTESLTAQSRDAGRRR